MSTNPAFNARLVRKVHAGLTLDVSLALDAECGVLFGPSGAGKTTVLRLIAGLVRPDDGRVAFDNEVIFDHSQHVDVAMRLRRIGLIYQDDLLFPHLSVADNIRFGLNGQPAASVRSRVGEVAALCGVEHLLARRPATLSGGERQRVGLARALAPRPRLLLGDEPVSALDLESRHALIERLRVVRQAEAIPLLYVTHSPAEAIALGAKVFLLAGGRIVDEGPPLDVLTAPRQWPVARLVGVQNILRGTVESHAPGGGETIVRLAGGPALHVPYNGRATGSAIAIGVRADDILLARGPVAGLSARNVLPGTVARIAAHGPEAEVLIDTGSVTWIASVVAPAVQALGLEPGVDVHMIIKARSCHILDDEPT